MRRWIVPWLLAGCGGGPAEPTTSSGPPTWTTTTSTTQTSCPTLPCDTTSTPPTTPTGVDLGPLLRGEVALDDFLVDVAWSGEGWPLRDPRGGYGFVLPTDTGPWQLVGDHDGWTGQAMLVGDGFVYLENVPVPTPEGSGYKFVGPAGELADPWARSYTHDAYGELSFVRAPTDRPRLDRWPRVEGEGLGPRTVRVYVPAEPGPHRVLYAHDGQNLFDPEGINGGWRLLDALAVGDPMVVVGIDNTGLDRMDEYTHVADAPYGYDIGGSGAAYARLVGDHIRPHVEATYGSTGTDGLLGSSLGGLISLYIAEQQPGAWDFAASMSGTLGWGRFGRENPVMDELWSSVAPGSVVLYLDSGSGPGADGLCVDVDGDGYPEDDPDDADNYCTTRQFADQRAAEGWSWDVDLVHWHEPGAIHSEPAWAARVDRPLDVFRALQ